MAQTIKLKRSATAGAIPGTSDLELGEIALNTRDGAVYIKKNDGSSDSIVAVHDNDILHIDTTNSRIGIGTTSPSGTFHVVGSSAIIDTADGSGLTINRPGNSAHIHLFPAYSSVPTIMGQGAGGLHLGYNSNTAGIRINTSNNVGIGTTSPASLLHLKTTADNTVSQGLVIERSANTDKGYINYNGGAFRMVATDGDPIKLGHVSGDNRLEVTSSGAVKFNNAYTFPTSDGSANQILKTDGSGALTFADESGGGASGQIETNTMTGDGTDTTLTLTSAPSSEDHLIVFVDGVYQNKDSYSISSTTLTFGTAPDNGTAVVAHHIKGGIVGTAPSINTMTGDNSDTTLTLSTAPVSENATFVTIDGVVQHKSTYSVSGTTLTFSTAPPTGSAVECITFANTTTASLTVKDADEDTKIQVEESSDEDKIRFDTAGTERMIITNAGNVGIGTSSPAEKLLQVQ